MKNGTERQIEFAKKLVARFVDELTYDPDYDFMDLGEDKNDKDFIELLNSMNDAVETIELLKNAESFNIRNKLSTYKQRN